VQEKRIELIENIERHQLMVAVRTTTPESAYKAAVACIEGGIKFIEITFSVPEAVSVIKELSVDSRVTVGAGTVLGLGDARKALNAGASYLVSPNCDEEVIRYTKEEGFVSIPGACTPTEIYRAYSAGGDIIKIFPFVQMGGLGFLKEIRGPFPFIRYMAAGGLNLDNISDYLSARPSCILIGSSIIKPELVKAGEWQSITELAKRFVRSRDDILLTSRPLSEK
jgi:2-dehydro-3-deoxyphosphogluconate aldolase/(4S)-4-hydroxy-2-oxoglutarate aldolase